MFIQNTDPSLPHNDNHISAHADIVEQATNDEAIQYLISALSIKKTNSIVGSNTIEALGDLGHFNASNTLSGVLGNLIGEGYSHAVGYNLAEILGNLPFATKSRPTRASLATVLGDVGAYSDRMNIVSEIKLAKNPNTLGTLEHFDTSNTLSNVLGDLVGKGFGRHPGETLADVLGDLHGKLQTQPITSLAESLGDLTTYNSQRTMSDVLHAASVH